MEEDEPGAHGGALWEGLRLVLKAHLSVERLF